jgi:hypothetical protein
VRVPSVVTRSPAIQTVLGLHFLTDCDKGSRLFRADRAMNSQYLMCVGLLIKLNE